MLIKSSKILYERGRFSMMLKDLSEMEEILEMKENLTILSEKTGRRKSFKWYATYENLQGEDILKWDFPRKPLDTLILHGRKYNIHEFRAEKIDIRIPMFFARTFYSEFHH